MDIDRGAHGCFADELAEECSETEQRWLRQAPLLRRSTRSLLEGRPGPDLRSDVTPAELYQSILTHTPATTHGVFVAGDGFRAIGVIAALEEDLGRPVLTVHQVAFWYALRIAGVGAAVENYVRLFRATPAGKVFEAKAGGR